MSLNRIVLVGRLTRDPEVKYTPNGKQVATMGIAVDRGGKNDQGEYEADFFNIVAWEKTADFAANYLQKGRLVSVDGRLQSRSWVDQSGQKRTVCEIVAERVHPLDRRPDSAPVPDAEAGAPPQELRGYSQPRPATRAATAPADDMDESDPFADE